MSIREKRTSCGRYREIDIYHRRINSRLIKYRTKKKKVKKPEQDNLKAKRSKRYFLQLANGNFTEKDYHVSLTYSNEFLPETVEEAEKETRNYFTKLKRLMHKKGIDTELKYILVTEVGKKTKRIHHHIILSCGLSRDEIEDCWSKGKGKSKKSIGYANTDRLRLDSNTGLEQLSEYMTKDPQGKKRWSSSRNLIRPYEDKKDNVYSVRKIDALANASEVEKYEYFAKKYPSYDITEIIFKYNDFNGWSVYIKAWKKRKEKRVKNE